uniref:Family with sequence similarity 131 member C n=1 Tax=Leptobrachium leishanense TaxID=445787 RepID=A0A8C5QLI4_9ANUR
RGSCVRGFGCAGVFLGVGVCGCLFRGSGCAGAESDGLLLFVLAGLVQTIKDHITKPTAMARGRVAHLIEWKGWSASQSGWDPSLTEEENYSDLTDELKEARFAAGVAEQFAITEATLSAWSSLDEEEMHYGLGSQEVRQLQGTLGLGLHDAAQFCCRIEIRRRIRCGSGNAGSLSSPGPDAFSAVAAHRASPMEVGHFVLEQRVMTSRHWASGG